MIFGRICKTIYENIFKTHQWTILIKLTSSDDWIRLKQPKNVSRADPFLVKYQDKYFIFFEEFDIKKRHGYICAGELDMTSFEIIDVKIILKQSYHLSFPNVFLYKDEYYMIPESSENNTVDLYKFSNFPYKLEKVKTILSNVSAADSVLFFKDNIWYLFTNLFTNFDCLHSRNLSIFQSSNFLQEEFVQTHKNPVETRQDISRMGGNFLILDDDLFRISQDCSVRYGYAINFMRVANLDKYSYSEELVRKILPPKGYIAMHTYNMCDNIEISDGKVIVKDIFVLLENIFQLIVKIFKRIFGVKQ